MKLAGRASEALPSLLDTLLELDRRLGRTAVHDDKLEFTTANKVRRRLEDGERKKLPRCVKRRVPSLSAPSSPPRLLRAPPALAQLGAFSAAAILHIRPTSDSRAVRFQHRFVLAKDRRSPSFPPGGVFAAAPHVTTGFPRCLNVWIYKREEKEKARNSTSLCLLFMKRRRTVESVSNKRAALTDDSALTSRR